MSRAVEQNQAYQNTQNGVPEIEKRAERIFGKMAKNSPNLMKNMNLPIAEAQQTPRRINSN